MKSSKMLITAILLMVLQFNSLKAEDNNWKSIKFINPCTEIGGTIRTSFSGTNLLFHLGGLVASGAIIYSGTDYKVHNYFRENDGFDKFSVPGVYLGYIVPVVLGAGLWAEGLYNHSSGKYLAGCAVLQATVIAVSYSTVLKAITGRPNPKNEKFENDSYSKEFNFGFLKRGAHYGWPSGHLLVNIAAVTSCMSYYKNNALVNTLGVTYLGYLTASVISHEKSTMHWTSDVVTGTLMGCAIGSSVGKFFRSKSGMTDMKLSEKTSFDISPNVNGFLIVVIF